MQNSHLLIVDDETMVRDLESTYLTECGYTCYPAANADEALLILETTPVDLAVIDINMPKVSGISLLRDLLRLKPDMAAIMVTANDEINTALFCLELGAMDYLVKPIHLDRLKHSVEKALDKRLRLLNERAYQKNLELILEEQTGQLRQAMLDLNRSQGHTLSALIRSLDVREHEVGAHSERVRDYALELARAAGIKGGPLEDIGWGALLHDIGKIGVSDKILLKEDHLSETERREIERHPLLGYEIVAGIDFLAGAAEIILTHHEHWNGRGYPRALKGEEIPIGSRVFSLVDTMDAMTFNRPYRDPLPFSTVSEEIRRCSGSQFDPKLVEIFLAVPRSRWEKLAGKTFL